MPQFRIDRRGAAEYLSVAPRSAETLCSGLRASGDTVSANLASRLERIGGVGGHGRPLRLQRVEANVVLALLEELTAHGLDLPADLAHLQRALREPNGPT